PSFSCFLAMVAARQGDRDASHACGLIVTPRTVADGIPTLLGVDGGAGGNVGAGGNFGIRSDHRTTVNERAFSDFRVRRHPSPGRSVGIAEAIGAYLLPACHKSELLLDGLFLCGSRFFLGRGPHPIP